MVSKVKRLMKSIRFKYAGTVKRLSSCSNCILLVIFVFISVIIISFQENDPKEDHVVRKLDDFQPASYVKVKHPSGTTLNEQLTKDNPKKSTKAITDATNSDHKIPKETTQRDFKAEKFRLFQESFAQFGKHVPLKKKCKKVMAAINIFYKDKYQKSEKNEAKVAEQKKMTYRDVFEAMAHPRLFPQTTEGYQFNDAPPRAGLNDWIQVNSPRDKNRFLVYSAYWDNRFDNNNVRIMAVMVTKNPPAVYCRLLMADGTHNDVPVVWKIMNEHWRLRYASYLLSCEVSKNSSPPEKVLVSPNRNFTHSAMLPVHNNKDNTASPKGDIAVCVKPFHYYYDRATWLAEFIELNRMLGAEHFFFYNHSVGQNVDALLRHYMQQKLVTILPWNLPVRSQKEIRTEGIFSSLNDCVFRTMYRFHYVVMLDFDEYIIPREHDNYLDMLEKLEEDNKRIRGKPGSFVFRNTFFYLYWENDTSAYSVEPEKPPQWMPYFVTQYKTRRLTTSMKTGSRSKYIVVPERVIEVGNHVVWRHASGSRAIQVPESVALLHHYRICEFGGYSCLKKPSLVDRTANKFGTELLNRVLGQCRKIYPELEGRCPISPPLGSPW